MSGIDEVRDVIARSLCTEASEGRSSWPCVTCVADAGDVMAALTLAGYFQTDDGAGETQATEGADHLDPAAQVDPAHGAPVPSSPRNFELVRLVDHSGVSGTGPVAEGTQFTDGSCAVRWHGDHPATAVWPAIEDLLAIHGHGGDTQVRWLDGGE